MYTVHMFGKQLISKEEVDMVACCVYITRVVKMKNVVQNVNWVGTWFVKYQNTNGNIRKTKRDL